MRWNRRWSRLSSSFPQCPQTNGFTTGDTAAISGYAEKGAKIEVDGRPVPLDAGNAFETTVSLRLGRNPTMVKATDRAGRVKTRQITVTRIEEAGVPARPLFKPSPIPH